MKQSIDYTLEDLLENIKEQFPESDEAFIYQWYHPVLKKYYIGSHAGTIDDSYTGSGIDFQKLLEGTHPTIEGKYPIEEWEREILVYCAREDKVKYAVEELFLKFYDVQNNPKFLNRTNSASGFGAGKDNHRYASGLFVGEPHSRQGTKVRREFWKSKTPEEMRIIRQYQQNQREVYKREKELREIIIGWGLNSEDRSKLCIQYQSDDELKKIKLEQLEELYKDIFKKVEQLNGGPPLAKFWAAMNKNK